MIGALLGSWKTRYAKSTAYGYRNKLKNLLTAMQPFGLQPMKTPRLPPPPARAVTATHNELVLLLSDPEPWLRLFILLYLQCGLRRSEALAVTPRTWDREQHTVTIPVKGGSTRTAQVTADVEILFSGGGRSAARHHLPIRAARQTDVPIDNPVRMVPTPEKAPHRREGARPRSTEDGRHHLVCRNERPASPAATPRPQKPEQHAALSGAHGARRSTQVQRATSISPLQIGGEAVNRKYLAAIWPAHERSTDVATEVPIHREVEAREVRSPGPGRERRGHLDPQGVEQRPAGFLHGHQQKETKTRRAHLAKRPNLANHGGTRR
jgi:hypothetical protein